MAKALAFLFLLPTLLHSSYHCCLATRHRTQTTAVTTAADIPSDGVVLPRVFFVPEDDYDVQVSSVALGLDQSVINSYPRFEFDRDNARNLNEYNNTCSIFLCEYKDSEMFRMMPECRHFFHLCCLDTWLRLRCTCTVSRN